MKLRVLSCSGSEANESHPCSFLVNDTVLIDMGSAASQLSITEQARVTDVILSHAHLDHTKDLAFFSENIFIHVNEPVHVHATADTLRKVRDHLMNNEIWPDFTVLPSQTQSVLKFEPFQVRSTLSLGDLKMYSVPVVHPGGCIGMFLSSGNGTVLYSGDTGPTSEIWQEANRRGKEITAILLETSFPNRLQDLADVSGHLTPNTMQKEIEKIPELDVPIYIYHIKRPYRDETHRDIAAIGDPRLHLLEPGMEITF